MSRFQQWLRINPATRPKIYTGVYADAELSNLTYWLGIIFSAGIATLGLVENSPAVIIGAMLISPLMGPIMATGLGLATGDLYLALKALFKLTASILLAMALSAVLVWILPFHATTDEILSRINPTLLDLGIALLSGLAGSVAVNRAGGEDSGITTLPGVAIAVALMPPLCTAGFGIGSGWRGAIIGGASLLFLTNLVAIVFSAFLLFLLAGMNTTHVRAGIAQLRAGETIARWLEESRFAKAFTETGELRWRVLLVTVLMAAVAFPLGKALRQLAGEAVTRDAVLNIVKTLVPSDALVSQQTVVGRGSVAVRLIATQQVAENKRRAAEQEIAQHCQCKARLSIQTVASQSELARLMEQMTAQAAPPVPVAPPAPKPLGESADDLLTRVQPAVAAVWPGDTPVDSFDLVLTSAGPQLTVRYASAKPLDPVAVSLIQNALAQKLASPELLLQAVQEAPPAAARSRRR